MVQSANEIKLAHKYIYLNPSDGNVDSRGQILMLPARHQESGIHSVFVKFLTTVDKELPLHFYAEQSYIRIKPGKSCLAFLQIANFTLHEFHVSTSYAVVPKFDSYFFKKLQCFCFDDQVIKPRSVTEVPIVFFLDNEAMHGAGFNDRHKNIAVEYNLHPYTEVDSKKSLETYPKASMDDRMLVYRQTRKPLGVS